MGFMDELRKLTQPYDDDDDFFEGAEDVGYKGTAPSSPAQLQFENTFGDTHGMPEPAPHKPEKPAAPDGSLFGNLGIKKPSKPRPSREKVVSLGGGETQVILFNPKGFDEAGDLVPHLLQNRSVLMTLEGIPTDTARRLLDFISGITFALDGKITPVSAKTYFITPQNVDLLAAQPDQPESDEYYF